MVRGVERVNGRLPSKNDEAQRMAIRMVTPTTLSGRGRCGTGQDSRKTPRPPAGTVVVPRRYLRRGRGSCWYAPWREEARPRVIT